MKNAQLYIYKEYEEPFECAILPQVDECDRLVSAIKYFGVLITQKYLTRIGEYSLNIASKRAFLKIYTIYNS